MQYHHTNKAEDLEIGQKVKYKNSPMDHSTPIDGRTTIVKSILEYRSQSTGNQLVSVENDVFVRDSNEFILV